MADNKELMNEEIMDDGYYTLTDEEGNEFKFELIGEQELKGTHYFAFAPVDDDNETEFCEYTILKSVIEDGEEILVSIEDDEEFDNVADFFDDYLSQEIDYDGEEN